MDILLSAVAVVCGFLFFVGLIGLLASELERPYRTPCTQPGGLMHQWSSPAFRLRVCDHCGRREFLLRAWEFDGYERKEL